MSNIGTLKMKATVLTNNLNLDLAVVPTGGIIQITEQTKFKNQLYVTLEMPLINARGEDLRLMRCLLVGSDYYCILAHPRAFDDEQFITALMVTKVVDSNNLIAISEENLQEVELACANAMKNCGDAREEDVRNILGDFPEYDF